jgi:hypothetical protein
MTENIVSVSLFYETPAARSDKYSMPIIFDGVTFDGGYEIQPLIAGQPFGGGYYAGQIAIDGGGVPTHYLVVADKALGQTTGIAWGPTATATGVTSVIDGPGNSAALAALGNGYEAANFCLALDINGYTDWYLPSMNELEVCYYYFKIQSGNNPFSGSNANAVSPEPISTTYTSGSPPPTTATEFIYGSGVQAFDFAFYLTSTELNADQARSQSWFNGTQGASNKADSVNTRVRAIRRIPV